MASPGDKIGYQAAGVDIAAGNALVEAIKPLTQATSRPGVVAGIGGFGALFDPLAAGYADPILVAATDGVGTKLIIAREAGRHQTVGIDLVAMCVNDLVVQGAEPLFFLDYYATGRLEVETARQVVAGIAEGCTQAGCALIGGETAEMPGMYGAEDYDLAGFALGAVERGGVLTGEAVQAGDVILGLASSGIHSNGFSLVRKLIEREGLDYADPAPFGPREPLGQALLHPTRIYVKSCLAAIAAGGVHALAHITGGGLTGNIPRVLPAGLGADLDAASWHYADVFAWLARTGGLDGAEMAGTFNCGIGMALICAEDQADGISRALVQAGETVSAIGRVTARAGARAEDHDRVRIAGTEDAWEC